MDEKNQLGVQLDRELLSQNTGVCLSIPST
jgi:hypothetical protein